MLLLSGYHMSDDNTLIYETFVCLRRVFLRVAGIADESEFNRQVAAMIRQIAAGELSLVPESNTSTRDTNGVTQTDTEVVELLHDLEAKSREWETQVLQRLWYYMGEVRSLLDESYEPTDGV